LVFMNNPWRGQAVINARTLIEDLRLTIEAVGFQS
jgi:hypothetical protein